MRCMVGHGARGTRRVVMTAGDRGASVSEGWSTDMAGLSMARRSNRAGTGSASVTVHGASMGLVAYTGKAREGQTGCEATEWESETSMRCMVGHGARGTRRVSLSVFARLQSVSLCWSFDAGGLSVVRRSNRRGSGSASLTLHGSSLGLSSLSRVSRVAQTGCEATEWESETAIRCLTGHGVRGTRRVMLTAGESSGSLTQSWSTDSPSLFNLLTERSIGWYCCIGCARAVVHFIPQLLQCIIDYVTACMKQG